MKILLVEDDVNLSKDIRRQFLAKGTEVDVAYDGLIAEKMVIREEYDCILVDVNIPGKSGYDLVKSIRARQITSPVVMLTAFGELDDKLEGFASGADDYLTKPFFFEELLARIKAILKRFEKISPYAELLTVGDLVINLKSREISRNGTVIKLTAREYEILVMLAEAGGDIVSKKEILNKVWGASYGVHTNTIEVFINILRNKIDKGFEPKLIKTRIGFGYYLGKN